MRIADPQQRQPGCSEDILRLKCRHGRLSQSFHIPGCGRPIIEKTEVRACSRVIMIFWLSRPLDLTLVLHIVDLLLGYPRRAQPLRPLPHPPSSPPPTLPPPPLPHPPAPPPPPRYPPSA